MSFISSPTYDLSKFLVKLLSDSTQDLRVPCAFLESYVEDVCAAVPNDKIEDLLLHT